jgi:serine/threonine-protein kinase RsbW
MPQSETLVIQSDPDNVVKVDEWAERIAVEMGFSEDHRDDIAISVTEAVNNAISHGNENDPNRRVVVEFEKGKDALKVTVRDEGGGFNPKDVDDPRKPENLMKPCGRGLLIIRKLMDEVSFSCGKNGMQVIMVKRRDQ